MKPLGLIAGNGQFPLLVAQEARRLGRSVVAAAIEGETDPALAEFVDTLHWMKLGQIKRTIEILIRPDGTLAVDAIGFKGTDCEQATKFLESALGLTSEKQRKPEYHQTNRNQHQQRLGS